MSLRLLSFATMLLALGATSRARIEIEQRVPRAFAQQEEKMLYLPSGAGLQFLSFGYRSALSQLLWFNTISYFGKHFRSDQNYQWLSHMCALVTDLNPGAHHVYEFCSMMLSWESRQPEIAVSVLNKAILKDPNYWNYYYLRGIVRMIFLQQGELAKDDFVRAAKLPGAHRLVARLAAKKLALLESNETAIEFLRELIRGSNDPAMRAALERRLEQIENGTLPMEKGGNSPLQVR